MIMGHTNYECSDFQPNSAKKNGRQSAILDLTDLKFCTLVDLMTFYKFAIHYVSEL